MWIWKTLVKRNEEMTKYILTEVVADSFCVRHIGLWRELIVICLLDDRVDFD